MRRLAVLLAALILATLVPLAPLAPVVSGCAAAGSGHVALVVEHGDGSVVTRCVAFDTTTISGEELLNQSGVAWSSQTLGGFGDAVCAVDGEPAHYVDCLGKDYYWALFVSRGGGPWRLSSIGISSLTLGNGDAEGFRYVPDAGTPAAPVSASGVCPAAVTPTPTRSVAAGTPGAAITPAARPTPGATPTLLSTNTTAEATAAGETAAVDGAAADSAAATRMPLAVVDQATGLTAVAAAGTGATSGGSGSGSGSGSGGLDIGLLAACVVGGGLAGLALLRLIAARRRQSAA